MTAPDETRETVDAYEAAVALRPATAVERIPAMHTQTHALRAYHNDSALRTATLVQLRGHMRADEIVQGQYWESGKGCAVGCLSHDPQGGHAELAERLAVPRLLLHLEDRIFEGLPVEAAKTWPMAFLSTIQTGADLSGVWPRFAHALLADPERGVALLTREGSAQRLAIDAVAALYQRTIDGETVPVEAWRKASSAAYAAADAAYANAAYANAAARSAAARSAAYAAADAAYANAAANAAYANAVARAAAAAAANAAAAARSRHYLWCRDKLLLLLAAAPVGAAS